MRWRKQRRGQVILMVTLALITMCGIMGLAVDLGWAYYVEKSAQAAADAAALAAVSVVFDAVSAGGTFGSQPTTSGALVRCSSLDRTSALGLGCVYAERNGFSDAGRQTVTMAAKNNNSPPDTAPRVGPVMYWATARASERIPQLFSAVMGHTMGGASARATAAVVWVEVPGQLYALDREYDYGTGPKDGGVGNDIYIQGGGHLIAGGDILLASTAGSGTDFYASEGSGGWDVTSINGGTYIRGTGWTTEPDNFWVGDSPPVQTPPENGWRDGESFYDPMRGKGQPPPPPAGATCAVPNGNLNAYCATGVCGPGYYYAWDPAKGVATGAQLTLKSGIRFSADLTTPCNTATASLPDGFGEYVFFGGMALPSERVDFDPGRYVFAGVKPAGSNPGILLDGRTQAYLSDNTLLGTDASGEPISVANTDAGEIFIFTDTSYYSVTKSGERTNLWIPPDVQPIASQLEFGIVDMHQGGAAGKTELNLHGLYSGEGRPVPANLDEFNYVLFWQDQRNSTVDYTDGGYINCGQTSAWSQKTCDATHSLDRPYYTDIDNGSPEMNLHATPGTHLFGIVYQPRGAWVIFHGGSDQMVSPITVISGAYSLRGGPTVRLLPMQRPMRRLQVALVE